MSNKISATLTMLCLSFLSISGLSGCASITSGTSQNVTVVTEKEVTGASCELTDSKGGKWYVPNTPGTATVRKGDGPMTLICKKDGYKPATHMVDETIAGATFGNIILGGGIGILVDAATGAAQHYPDKIIVWMEPLFFKSDNDKKDWYHEKEDFEAQLAKKNNPQENSTEIEKQ